MITKKRRYKKPIKKKFGYKPKYKKIKKRKSYTTKEQNYKQIQNFYESLQHPEKYCGKENIITLRSSYEIKYVIKLDNSDLVEKWSSEDIIIRYLAHDGKWRRYYTDFYIKLKDGYEYIIEVKPVHETKKPNEKKFKTYSY